MREEDVIISGEVQCPWCKHINKNADEKWCLHDGEQHGLFCSKCGKNFYVRVERPIEYAISKEPI
jgi:transposase-like protein